MDIQKIRSDFPALWKKWNGKYPIYFDNACMTLKPKQVMDAMIQKSSLNYLASAS